MINQKNMLFIIVSLSFFALTPSLPTDGYIPSIVYIQKYFQLNDSMMQWSLSLFTFTAGLSQIIFGPLSDRYGRRSTAFITMIIFALGSFLYMYAETYSAFLFCRFMQGLGAAGMIVIAPAIVRDLYNDEQMGKAYGYLGALCALSPIIAPLLGGYLVFHFGWQSVGWMFFTSVGLAMLTIYALIPETLPKTKRIKLNFQLFKNYKNILFDKSFLFYSLISAIGLSFAFIFSSVSAYILMSVLKVSDQHYSMYYACYGVILFLGSILAAQIINKIGINRVILYGLLIGITGAIGMLIWNYFFTFSSYSFYLPMMIIIVGSAFCQTAGVTGAMQKFAANAGAALALNSAIRFIFISLVGVLTVSKNIQSVYPVVISISILSLLGLLYYWYVGDR